MNHIKKIAFAIAVIALVAAPALAKRHGGESMLEHGGKGQQNLEMLKVALDLTPQQQEDIRQVVDESRKNVSALRKAVHENKTALRAVMDKEILNESQLQALAQEQARMQTEMMIMRHATKAKIDELLTPEQQLKHQELRQLRMERKQHKRFAKGQGS